AFNNCLNEVDPLGLSIGEWLEDQEALEVLTGAAKCSLVFGRTITARMLSNYLRRGGDLTLTDSEMDQVIANLDFQRFSSGPNLAASIGLNGPGAIDHGDSVWLNHRFYNNRDGDLWSAFNDIRFKNDLMGCISVSRISGNLVFRGTVTWHFSDYWGFSDPAMDGRTPFQFWDWLPDRYQYFEEGKVPKVRDSKMGKTFRRVWKPLKESPHRSNGRNSSCRGSTDSTL
ncbi:MAG: hypothetical protein L0287_37885, partial [Anaerolineae bacterium]|nr:hypothetical protein [Anaerolineae bacterium]